MIYPKHIQEDHEKGKWRIARCIAQCYNPSTLRGTFYSDRFKPEQIITARHIYVKLPNDYVYMSNIRIMK